VLTLAQFQDYVRAHEISYYVAQNLTLPKAWGGIHGGERRPGPGGWWPGAHRDVADWVATHFPAQRLGQVTVYDLTRPNAPIG
jgi:hypothetical protein